MIRVPVDALTGFGAALLASRGAPDGVAKTVARSLVSADMRGVASHGVVRLPMMSAPHWRYIRLSARVENCGPSIAR